MTDAAPAADRCPRCGGPVGCGIASTGPCWCTTVRLDDTQRAEIARQYRGCLCGNCLRAWPAHDSPLTPAAPT